MYLRSIAFLSAACLAACAPGTEPGRQKVRDSLKDPESAQFRNEVVAKSPALFCGEVNAKNSMGGYVGFKRYIVTPELVVYDGDKSAVLLRSKDPEKSAAQDAKVMDVLKHMPPAVRFNNDKSLEVMLRVIFEDSWNASCKG